MMISQCSLFILFKLYPRITLLLDPSQLIDFFHQIMRYLNDCYQLITREYVCLVRIEPNLIRRAFLEVQAIYPFFQVPSAITMPKSVLICYFCDPIRRFLFQTAALFHSLLSMLRNDQSNPPLFWQKNTNHRILMVGKNIIFFQYM